MPAQLNHAIEEALETMFYQFWAYFLNDTEWACDPEVQGAIPDVATGFARDLSLDLHEYALLREAIGHGTI